MVEKVKKYLNEVTLELKKVSWSTRDELIAATTATIILVIILAVFIGLCDVVLSKIVNMVIRSAYIR